MVERDTRFGGNLELANIGDAGIASLAKQQLDFDRSNREFARFHAKSDPTAQEWEKAKYEQYNHPEFINARSPRVFRNTQWSPNYPGPKFDTRFIVGANKSSEGLRSWPSSDYYQDMRERNKFHQSFRENEIRNMILGPNRIYSNEPDVQAGIPATNQGYKVWNASDPTGNDGWIDRLGRWLFNDPYDKESDESLYQGTEQDKLESEYGTEGTGEFYPDKILRDLYPQYFGGLESEDLGMEQLPLEASGDSYNIMAGELIRSGLFDPVEIQNMDSYELQQNYENTFGSESDAMQMSLNLQDAMDAHEALGLSLNTDRFTRRANKAGVQVTNRGGIMGLV